MKRGVHLEFKVVSVHGYDLGVYEECLKQHDFKNGKINLETTDQIINLMKNLEQDIIFSRNEEDEEITLWIYDGYME